MTNISIVFLDRKNECFLTYLVIARRHIVITLSMFLYNKILSVTHNGLYFCLLFYNRLSDYFHYLNPSLLNTKIEYFCLSCYFANKV
jgi:hypothetical protein